MIVHHESRPASCRRQVRRQQPSKGDDATSCLTRRQRAMFFGVFWLPFAVALPEHPETGSTTDPCPVNNETYQVVCQASTTDVGSVSDVAMIDACSLKPPNYFKHPQKYSPGVWHVPQALVRRDIRQRLVKQHRAVLRPGSCRELSGPVIALCNGRADKRPDLDAADPAAVFAANGHADDLAPDPQPRGSW